MSRSLSPPACLQAGCFNMTARALGYAGARIKSFMWVKLGRGDPAKVYPGGVRFVEGLSTYSIDGMFCLGYSDAMTWEVEYTDEFGDWWSSLSEEEQEALAASVRLLEVHGPALGFPHSSGIKGSKHSHMRELRTQHGGRPLRTLYAFDPKCAAILLIGGDKSGDDRWYDIHVPMADRLYDEHLEQLRKEGLIDG